MPHCKRRLAAAQASRPGRGEASAQWRQQNKLPWGSPWAARLSQGSRRGPKVARAPPIAPHPVGERPPAQPTHDTPPHSPTQRRHTLRPTTCHATHQAVARELHGCGRRRGGRGEGGKPWKAVEWGSRCSSSKCVRRRKGGVCPQPIVPKRRVEEATRRTGEGRGKRGVEEGLGGTRTWRRPAARQERRPSPPQIIVWRARASSRRRATRSGVVVARARLVVAAAAAAQ